MDKKTRISRVDVQVSLIVAVIVIASFICVYFFHYTMTYEDMVNSLKKRSDSIYNYVENYVDKSTFIGSLTSQDEGYISTKEKLEDVKVATNVRYLYTAKQNEEGVYIYLVDGLPTDSEDFRNPNDVIEPEVIPELQRALNNEIIVPDTIKKTTWGDIFVAYYPIHEDNKVIGVLGMEFDAHDQYETFKTLRIGTPIIAAIACVIAVLIAGKQFRRISNPNFKDLANTDYLTKLKNRNAFMLDIHNIEVRDRESYSIIVADMNDLKIINDTYGHQVGDECINAVTKIISSCAGKNPSYRIGGDEFVVIVHNNDHEYIEGIISDIITNIGKIRMELVTDLTIAISYASFDEKVDRSLMDTFKRADYKMYDMKKHKYSL